MTLNSVMAVTLCYLTELGKPALIFQVFKSFFYKKTPKS